MALSPVGSDPDMISRSSTPDGLPSDGFTVSIYYSAGKSPEVLSIAHGRGEFDHGSHSRTVEELEKKLMALKHTDLGKRKRRKKNKTRKIPRK